MTQLRSALPGAIVIKHHDASMIGLPDCSVTWRKTISWLEFKLVVPKRFGRVVPAEIAGDSPTQHRFMCNVAQQAHLALYLMWVKRSHRIIVWEPLSNQIIVEHETTPQLVDWFTRCLSNL
jgi:hypothetical protein